MSIIETFTPGCNFWLLHPTFTVANPFKDIYNQDTSENKITSSKMMWFVILCYDMESKYYNLPTVDKHTIIGEDFCDGASYYDDYKDIIDPCIEMYTKMIDTPAKRSLRNWRKKLEERDAFIDSTPFTMDSYNDRAKLVKGTADQLDAMIGRTTKLWSELERIEESLEKEESQGEGRGGAMPSASDEGNI